MFFVCDQEAKAAKLAGAARLKIGSELGLSKKDVFEFCWIVDFPMYEWNEEDGKIDFSHNPFSMPNFPHDDFVALDAADKETILGIKAFQYDIVCNGIELSSGAIRNHRPDIMKKAFALAGYGEDVLEQKFGGMYRAFQYGAPPHGGHRAGRRSHRHAARGRGKSARDRRLPDEPEGGRPAYGCAVAGHAQAIARAAYPAKFAGDKSMSVASAHIRSAGADRRIG